MLNVFAIYTFNTRGQCELSFHTVSGRATSFPFSVKPRIPIMADAGSVEALLQLVEKADGGVDSLDVASRIGVDHQVIVGAVKSLQSLGDVSFPS